MYQGLECIFDWLQFTIHGMNEEQVILKVLQMNPSDFIPMPKGRYGYKRQLASGHISVLYDGTEDMGVHVALSGQGCREYESVHSILTLLDKVMLYDGKCSRIDIAMDDKGGNLIPFNKIIESVRKGHVSSRWKTSTEFIKRKLEDGSIIGHTINIGSGKSKIYMRIYNKALEQEKETPWTRIEMEIKDERAEVLQNILLFENEIGHIFARILNNYIRFLQPTNDSNKSRWPTAPWWLNLLKEVDRVSLTRKPGDRTIEDVREWIKKQVGPSLALLVLADGGAVDEIYKIIHQGKNRLREKHMRILNKTEQSDGNSRLKPEKEEIKDFYAID